jgi:hypothetical protein
MLNDIKASFSERDGKHAPVGIKRGSKYQFITNGQNACGWWLCLL